MPPGGRSHNAKRRGSTPELPESTPRLFGVALCQRGIVGETIGSGATLSALRSTIHITTSGLQFPATRSVCTSAESARKSTRQPFVPREPHERKPRTRPSPDSSPAVRTDVISAFPAKPAVKSPQVLHDHVPPSRTSPPPQSPISQRRNRWSQAIYVSPRVLYGVIDKVWAALVQTPVLELCTQSLDGLYAIAPCAERNMSTITNVLLFRKT